MSIVFCFFCLKKKTFIREIPLWGAQAENPLHAEDLIGFHY